MTRITTIILCVLIPFCCYSQTGKPGDITYLKSTKGFNGIVLGAEIATIPPNCLAYLDGNRGVDADSCKFYEYRDADQFKLRAELNLESIAIRVYKNKVINIYLFYYKKEGFKILNKFLTMYGQFTERPDNYTDVYNWSCSSVNLSLRYQLNVDLGVAIFNDREAEEEIKEKKRRFELLQQMLVTTN